ncbi:cupin-like domain-containing protein [Cyathus striatus]|nr:cupin-like domain-containing protein [Cyathus striatus]
MDQHTKSKEWLAREYREFNKTFVDVLDHPPSSILFSQLIHISRPVVIKGWKVAEHWSDAYLTEKMSTRQISIAVTPNGRADAITRHEIDGRRYFTEPHVEKMTMSNFLGKLSEDSGESGNDIYYLQSQNGNLYSNDYFQNIDSESEFQPLRNDVPAHIPWCTEALGRTPDAVNIWIGDAKSITSVHSDPYENIYSVVRGAKHFTLFPPTEALYLKERLYPHATYRRSSPGTPLRLIPSASDIPAVRWTSILDPDAPNAVPDEVQRIHITIYPGEALYLPVGWWHYVRQSPGTNIALNWWYDPEMQGMSWTAMSFMRELEVVPPGNELEDNDANTYAS